MSNLIKILKLKPGILEVCNFTDSHLINLKVHREISNVVNSMETFDNVASPLIYLKNKWKGF